ncbi:putative quinol monooxygenase [Mucilaginibacter sp.]|uniref:putative quinol monooxygenase n=1 Tax=Mucilaginibacter sp. TaxID=1882438 RepID=UPI003D0DC3FA
MKLANHKTIIYMVYAILTVLILNTKSMAQDSKVYRIAKIQVDSMQLDKYKTALNEQMSTAIAVEPGVLSYYAVSDKKVPSHITIFEIYASNAAYNYHIQTAHFKKYKETVKNMVKSLQLEDVNIILSSKKPGL